MGSLQTNEALKLLLGIGEPPTGRLILFDALEHVAPPLSAVTVAEPV